MSHVENGSVVAIRRYPVKSMMGENLVSVDITARGLHGDRTYALIDAATGKIASAKNPLKWARLLEFRAALGTPARADTLAPVLIRLPDGGTVTSEQQDVDRILSRSLGRGVSLASAAPRAPSLEQYWPDIEGLPERNMVSDEEMPSGTFFDGAVVHVLSTATMHRLQQLYPEGRFDARRFRPNIVVDPRSREGFVENDWVGLTLAIGNQVRLRITSPCPRCVMTTLPQSHLPKDPGILRATAHHNQLYAGVYASVVRGGSIHYADTVRLE